MAGMRPPGSYPATAAGFHPRLKVIISTGHLHDPAHLPGHGPDAATERPGDGRLVDAAGQQPEQVPVVIGQRRLAGADRVRLVQRDGLLPDGLEQLGEGGEQRGRVNEVSGLAGPAVERRYRY